MIQSLRAWFRGAPPEGKALGRAGERLAARELRRRRYRLMARNLTVAPGEADLVFTAPDGRTLVIVEVKTRLATDHPGAIRPEANIDAAKRRKLVQVARAVVARLGAQDRPLRIDVVAIDWRPGGRHSVRHYENAVTDTR